MQRTCTCGEAMVHRDGYGGEIVAGHCRVCHITVRAGDPCACQEANRRTREEEQPC